MKKKKQQKKYVYKPLNEQNFISKILRYNYFGAYDLFQKIKNKTKKFNEYGLTIYCGMQGDGKTISMVEKLEQIRHEFPEVTICTNFGYIHEDVPLDDWLQILEMRNPHGIIFAIDEIQNEFSVYDTRNFSENILRTVTQQRKQGIKIYATSQHFNRVVKQLREQTFEVVDCVTLGGRWTFQKRFSADEYNAVIDSPERKLKLKRKWRKNFVQTDYIRSLYDTYKVIENMAKLEHEARKKEKA